MNKSPNTPRVGFVSLGCPKALVDSERIVTQLRAEGYEISPDYDGVDLVVINTCGFIEQAVEESLSTITEAINENGKVIVTGCLGAKDKDLLKKFPELLAVTGPHATEEVMLAVHEFLKPGHDPLTDLIPPQGIKLTPKHYAYLKISEGCNHRCSFCIIPSLRGDLVSRPIGEVMDEAERLVQADVKELLVIAQDTSAYGVDLKYQTGFWQGKPIKTRMTELTQALGSLGVWIRLHYVYPYPHVDEVIPLMAEGKILPYLDIPFQHANKRILKAMKRPGDIEKVLRRIEGWRKQCPELVLRSTFIVGFPGETEAEFEELLAFLKEAQLDRVGCFPYSPIEGASANDLPDHIGEDEKQDRVGRFMSVQARISEARLSKRIGSQTRVLIDSIEDHVAYGRSYGEAPDIDGLVMIKQADQLIVGEFVQVEITDADTHDLQARIFS